MISKVFALLILVRIKDYLNFAFSDNCPATDLKKITKIFGGVLISFCLLLLASIANVIYLLYLLL
jgi:hypothetical protein